MALIRTIFFIIAFYYIFRFLGRVLLPIFIKMGINKMTGNANQQEFYRESKKSEGKVTIQKTQEHKKMAPDDMGEYVKYEEVK